MFYGASPANISWEGERTAHGFHIVLCRIFIFLLPPFSLQPITCTSKVVIGEFPNFNSLSPLSVCLLVFSPSNCHHNLHRFANARHLKFH